MREVSLSPLEGEETEVQRGHVTSDMWRVPRLVGGRERMGQCWDGAPEPALLATASWVSARIKEASPSL